MSSSAGIGGAFGLLLPEFPQVAAIYGDLKIVVNKAIEEESAQNPGDMESAPEVLELRDRLIRRLRRTGSLFRHRPHCCGRGPRLIAWRDARLRPMSGSLDMEYSRTPGIIRPWTNPLGKTPAFIPGRG